MVQEHNLALMGVVTKLVSYARNRSEAIDEPYECKACGNQFSERYHQCPDCESYRVERREWQFTE